MENSRKAEKRKQEDAALNRALLWFAAAVVLEFLLLIVNKYYINFTTAAESVALAQAFQAGLKVFGVVGLLGAVLCGVWGWNQKKKQGKLPFLPVLLGGTLLAAAAAAFLVLKYHSAAVQLLYILVPAGAVAALVYYLYQKEFFLSLCSVALGLLGLWLVRKNGGGHDVLMYGYVVIAAVLLLAVVLLVSKLKKSGGMLVRGDKQYRLLPKRANFLLVILSCLASLLAMLAGLLLGPTAAYYLLFVLMAWLFVLLVYYTVKLM